MELIYVTLRNVYLPINKVAWLSLWQVDDQLTVKKIIKKNSSVHTISVVEIR